MNGEAVPGAAELCELMWSSGWMVRVLTTVRESGLPDAWVGAGVLRDLVWGERFGAGFDAGAVRDVDVAFFDPRDLSRARDAEATARLCDAWPSVAWEATNQAAVHEWYAADFGGTPVSPLRSIHEAVATWPETATAVAVRLKGPGPTSPAGSARPVGPTQSCGPGGPPCDLDICAPYGLGDLLRGVWRRNPTRVSLQRSRERLARHRPAERWPGVTVVPPDA